MFDSELVSPERHLGFLEAGLADQKRFVLPELAAWSKTRRSRAAAESRPVGKDLRDNYTKEHPRVERVVASAGSA